MIRRRAPRANAPDPEPGPIPSARSGAVLAGYRLVRRLATGERAGVHLAVVDRDGDRGADPALVVIRIYPADADDVMIATEIAAMQADATRSAPALLDVAALPDGRSCLVVERIAGRSLGEHLVAGSLTPGQAVTALAPIVVASRELARHGFAHVRLSASDVHLDATGRPRLLGLGALESIGDGVAPADRIDRSRRAHRALATLVEDVAAATVRPGAFRPVLDLMRATEDRRPFQPDLLALERALFAVADPVPLVRSGGPGGQVAVPSRIAAEAVPAGAPAPAPGGGSIVGATRDPRASARSLAELAQLPGTLADEFGEALDAGPLAGLGRRWTAWMAGRRAVVAVGGLVGAGALVALLTAVPPGAGGAPGSSAPEPPGPTQAATKDDEGADTDDPAAADRARPAAATHVTPSTAAPDPVDPEDPVAAAAALLEIRTGCLAARDADCIAAYAQSGSPIEARDRAIASGAGEPDDPVASLDDITIGTDLGDAVVLRVPSSTEREPASLLMIRSEAGWRLREWFD
ncbi:serine/threonine-protein kinase [Agromyces marinus]|uniref:hypothetical protein n=1 Tax=Agromyces marinus TaxID=1389020 RepID=UPI001F39D46A|nr:hypothetical protein [Agromyces marinus]UIP58546.1 hypothetical protein DSM26151_14240 [Agromyces marinus]